MPELAAIWTEAPPFEAWLPTAEKNRELWEGLHARTRLPAWAMEAAQTVPRPVRLMVLSADWCGDAVNILPWVARLADAAPALEMRVLERDAHLALMDAHLTGGRSRSIPVVLAFDEAWQELGWWGPRPSVLQAWVTGDGPDEGRALPPEVRYARVRRWYARDRGRAILEEILALVGADVALAEAGSGAANGPAAPGHASPSPR